MLRGEQVILDKDIALFYQVKPIRLRKQAKRNIDCFLSDFMFQVTENELVYLVSQNAIPDKQALGGYLSYVFT
ncbi:MAG: ORF6N domain-containing protein [Bacteroidales bacterium]